MAKTLNANTIKSSATGNNVTSDAIDTRSSTFIIVSIASDDSASHPTLTDSKGNSWTPVTAKDDGIGSYIQSWFCSHPAVDQFHTFTATSSGKVPTIMVQSWDLGSGKTGVLDVEAQNSGSSGTGGQTGSVTPSFSDDLLVVAICAYFSSGGFSLNLSYIVSDSAAVTGGSVGAAMGYKDGGSGATNPAFNWSTSTNFAAHQFAIKIVDTIGAGSAAATSSASAVGMATFSGAGASSESSTCSAVGRGEAAAAGASSEVSTATAIGRATAAGVGTASGSSSVAAVSNGASFIIGFASSSSQAYAYSIRVQDMRPRLRQLIPLIEVDFDSGTLRWAMDGSDTPDGFYFKRIQSIGSIDREVPRLCGLFTISSVTFVCFNHDQYMSRLRANEAWRGRRARILFGDAFGSFDDFTEAYSGNIAEWHFEGDLCTITIEDNAVDRFNVPVTKYLKRLVAGGYPDATPENAQPYLIPWALGPIQPPDGGSNGGQLPAYCINGSTFVYVACHETLMTIDRVYVYGALKTETVDYTIGSMVATGGETFRTITFLSDPRDLVNHAIDEVEVTWCGHSTEENPITHFQYYLTSRGGVDASEFGNSWAGIIAEFSARLYRGSLVITKADYTIADVIARVCRTWGLRMFLTRDGLWDLDFIGLPKAAVLTLTEKDVLNFSQSSYPSDGYAARLHFNYDYNYAKPNNEYFRHTPDLISAAEADNLGSDIPFNLNQWFARTIDGDASVPLSLATFYLGLMRENGIITRFEIDIRNFNRVDLGDVVSLTHWEGISPDGGFAGKNIIVLHTQMVPSPESSQLILTGYADPEPVQASPSLSAVFTFSGGLVVEEVTAS